MTFLSKIRLGSKLRLATIGMLAALVSIVAVSLITMGRIRSAEQSAQMQEQRTSMAQDMHTRVVTSVMHVGSLLVHEQGFGERECFADETSQPLPQGIIPALHMSGFLSQSAVLLFWNDCLISLPKIRVAVSSTVSWWNGLP